MYRKNTLIHTYSANGFNCISIQWFSQFIFFLIHLKKKLVPIDLNCIHFEWNQHFVQSIIGEKSKAHIKIVMDTRIQNTHTF